MAKLHYKSHIGILSRGSISPWGDNVHRFPYKASHTFIGVDQFGEEILPVGVLPNDAEEAIKKLSQSHKAYKQLDRSVLLAIQAARHALSSINIPDDSKVGINIGSSRGATGTFEKYYKDFLVSEKGETSPYTSPTTTLGNIASWVMADLGLNGSVLSHSITCSTAIQAIANAEAWLLSGKADDFIAGGSEAPLTAFTLAQMQALKIYTQNADEQYPSRPLAKKPTNGMVLGEGAGIFYLKALDWQAFVEDDSLILLESTGFGNEPLEGFTGISREGTCFKRAMEMALNQQDTGFDVDIILMHAPGTVKGDQAEINAVNEVFSGSIPMLYSNKWQIGHSFGASAALSLVQAINILNQQEIPEMPYASKSESCQPPIRKIMVNAAGFGGNAGSLIVSKPF